MCTGSVSLVVACNAITSRLHAEETDSDGEEDWTTIVTMSDLAFFFVCLCCLVASHAYLIYYWAKVKLARRHVLDTLYIGRLGRFEPADLKKIAHW